MFYLNRFFAVAIEFNGYRNFNMLKNTLFEVYGKSAQENQYLDEYMWRGKNIGILLNYNDITEDGKILYNFLPIWIKMKEDEKKRK